MINDNRIVLHPMIPFNIKTKFFNVCKNPDPDLIRNITIMCVWVPMCSCAVQNTKTRPVICTRNLKDEDSIYILQKPC